MTSRSSQATALLQQLEQSLPETLVAQSTLGQRTEQFDEPGFEGRRRGDFVFVQGRGDRLHGVLCAGEPELEDSALLERFAGVDVNWAWLAVAAEDVPRAIALARKHRCGVLAVGTGAEKVLDAPPRPGIFIKQYPALRKQWREIESW